MDSNTRKRAVSFSGVAAACPLGVSAVARELGTSPAKVLDLIHNGPLRAFRVGRQLLVKPADLAEFRRLPVRVRRSASPRPLAHFLHFTVPQAARRMGLQPRDVRRLVRSRDPRGLEGLQVGRRIFVTGAAIARFQRRHPVAARVRS
jgi:excisionase family DNA binding protein